MALAKINVYETIERVTEVTFEVPDDMELPTGPQAALDALHGSAEAVYIGSDVIEENVYASRAGDLGIDTG